MIIGLRYEYSYEFVIHYLTLKEKTFVLTTSVMGISRPLESNCETINANNEYNNTWIKSKLLGADQLAVYKISVGLGVELRTTS